MNVHLHSCRKPKGKIVILLEALKNVLCILRMYKQDEPVRDNRKYLFFTFKKKEIPFLIDILLSNWFTTARLNCAYLLQPGGSKCESATSKYIER